MIACTCPVCSHAASVPDKFAGKRVKCPKCGEAFVAAPPVVANRVLCPSCGVMLEATLGQVGAKAVCPECGQKIMVPRPDRTMVGIPAPQPMPPAERFDFRTDGGESVVRSGDDGVGRRQSSGLALTRLISLALVVLSLGVAGYAWHLLKNRPKEGEEEVAAQKQAEMAAVKPRPVEVPVRPDERTAREMGEQQKRQEAQQEREQKREARQKDEEQRLADEQPSGPPSSPDDPLARASLSYGDRQLLNYALGVWQRSGFDAVRGSGNSNWRIILYRGGYRESVATEAKRVARKDSTCRMLRLACGVETEDQYLACGLWDTGYRKQALELVVRIEKSGIRSVFREQLQMLRNVGLGKWVDDELVKSDK